MAAGLLRMMEFVSLPRSSASQLGFRVQGLGADKVLGFWFARSLLLGLTRFKSVLLLGTSSFVDVMPQTPKPETALHP